ncbi:MAG: AI-2E family transporter [Solirubrobacterales bacterium]|nr:AI-2E family transporter [Solirubrobacterales bacterium]
MEASRIEPRAVAKIVLVALFFAALAVLLAIVILHTRTTLRWVAAAIFLALALDPAVGLFERISIRRRSMPRVGAILIVYLLFLAALVFLILHVFPPIVREIEGLGKSLPTYVKDFEHWAENNQQFRELNDKYDLTAKLSEQASSLPSALGQGASELESLTVSLIEHLIAAITVLTVTFFLLLDGRGMFERGTGRLRAPTRDRLRRVGLRIAKVVCAYVSVNVLLAAAVGFLTYGFLVLLGFHLALPMAVLVAFLDLIPLIGLTVGGAIVATALVVDGQPGHVLIWIAVFLVYQQAQDRAIQPLLYKSGALKVNPAVAIIAVLVGANLAGVLGALLAIPTAASLGVVVDEFVLPPARAGRAAKPKTPK